LFKVRIAAVACALWLAGAAAAVAHPLGNFTINHLAKVNFAPGKVKVRYVLDMAEIPTFGALHDLASKGHVPAQALQAFGQTTAASLLPQLQLSVDGRPVPLGLQSTAIRTRPGAGGLPTLYLTLDASSALAGADAARRATFSDLTYPGRLGWHDVVVAPAGEPTHELTAYPNALLGSPRAVTSVDVALTRDGVATVTRTSGDGSTAGTPTGATPLARSNQLSDMLARGTGDWGFVAITFLVAILLGALHALEPGHGKTLLAISLVGARATVKQATILASALTVAHTIGVLALGVAINLFKGYFVPEAIYPWITLVSGCAIAIIGARAVQRQIEARRPVVHAHAHGHAATHDHDHEHAHRIHETAPHAHAHGDAGHTHSHGAHAHSDAAHGHPHGAHAHSDATHRHSHAAHGHSHGGHSHDHDDLEHARQHAIPGTAPLKFGATVWAAMSGAVAPCPAALVVLLAAVALNQVTYGIFVIVAFSFGLAGTLTGLGIAVVRGASWLKDRPQFERFVHWGPLVSAIAISGIGAIMVGQGFAQQGIAVSPLIVTAIVALAVAGYAFSHPFAHRALETA
jgi:nickel/cobalt transporter (NicO) family protein